MPSLRSCTELPMRLPHVVLRLPSDFLEAHSASKTPNQRSLKVRWPYVCGRLGSIAPPANQTPVLQACIMWEKVASLVWEEV